LSTVSSVQTHNPQQPLPPPPPHHLPTTFSHHQFIRLPPIYLDPTCTYYLPSRRGGVLASNHYSLLSQCF
jgi:hypothetical protein